MPLPEDYLQYPHRKHGMDQDRYEWRPAISRPAHRLGPATAVMANIIVPLEFFPLNPPKEPFKHPGAMVTPYPDLRHYTTRDYGNRVGVYRMLRLFRKMNIKATFAVNSEVARRYPSLIEHINSEGHELAAHGVSTAHIHHDGLLEDDESGLLASVREVLPGARAWMSPARNQSFRTLDLMAKFGFSVCLDWEMDQTPVNVRTKNGDVVCTPNHIELSDWTQLVERCHSEADWIRQIYDAALFLRSEYDKRGSQSFGFVLTPYISGQPYRIEPLKQLLQTLQSVKGVVFKTVSETAAALS